MEQQRSGGVKTASKDGAREGGVPGVDTHLPGSRLLVRAVGHHDGVPNHPPGLSMTASTRRKPRVGVDDGLLRHARSSELGRRKRRVVRKTPDVFARRGRGLSRKGAPPCGRLVSDLRTPGPVTWSSSSPPLSLQVSLYVCRYEPDEARNRQDELRSRSPRASEQHCKGD